MNPDDLVGVFSDLGSAQKIPPTWVVENILPAGITFLAGPPKAMKSTVEMALALTVAGVPNTVLPEDLRSCPEPGHVLIWSAEATAGELRQMCEDGFGVTIPDDGRILVADEPFQWRLDDPNALNEMTRWLDIFRPKLFCIDPLRDFHDFDERESGPMNRLLRPLQRWAKLNNAAMLVVHHARKLGSEEDRNLTAGDLRGTSALFGLADGVITLTPKGRAGIHFNAISKKAQPWERTIKLGAWQQQQVEEKLDTVTSVVWEALLATPEASQAALADSTKKSKSAVSSAIAALKRLGAVDADGRPVLPDGLQLVANAKVKWSQGGMK